MSVVSNHHPEIIDALNAPESLDDFSGRLEGPDFPDQSAEDWGEYSRWSEALDQQRFPRPPGTVARGSPSQPDSPERTPTMIESWRMVWRDGIAPALSTAALQSLHTALVADDPRLIQGLNTEPPPVQSERDHP